MRTPRPWFLVTACALGLFTFTPPVSAAPLETGLSARARSQIEALAAAKAARTPAEAKIGSSLLAAAQLSRGLAVAPGVQVKAEVASDGAGRTRVAIHGHVTRSLLAGVRAAGGIVRTSRPADGVLSADLPLAAVSSLATRSEVTHISSLTNASTTWPVPAAGPDKQNRKTTTEQPGPPDRQSPQERARLRADLATGSLTTASGSVVSEGDQAQGVDRARSRLRLSGIGVTVGVLSDGVDTLASEVRAGELPPGVNVLSAGLGDRGTAMLEIVHDLAPHAKLAFAAANDGQEQFVANIRALRAAGADVIVDDTLFLAESPFQDGPIAQAVTDVTADGALYFSSAGDFGNVDDATSGNYEGTFSPSKRTVGKFAGSAHDFDPGRGVQTVDPTAADAYGAPTWLHWADPLGAARDDYDLYALDTAGNVVAYSTDVQDGDDDPVEGLVLPDAGGPVHLAVVKFKGANRPFQLTALGGRLAADGSLKAYVSPGSIRGHATVPAAFSVAAAPAHEPLPQFEPGQLANPAGPFPNAFARTQQAERFSADGPRRMFFRADGKPLTKNNGGEVRTDPDLTAADGVYTGVRGDPFYGTAAAAAHAAGIAALAASGNPGLTASEFRTALASSALDIEGRGRDRDTGYGILMAEPFLAKVGAKAQSFVTPGSPTVTWTTDGDTFLERGERADVAVPVVNRGDAAASGVSVSVRSNTPGVTVSPVRASYGTVTAGAHRVRTFHLTLPASSVLGSEVSLTSQVRFRGGRSPQTGTGSLSVGEPSATTKTFGYAGAPVAIPDNDVDGVSIPIKVTGIGPVSQASFSLDGTSCDSTEGSTTVGIDHTFDRDLVGVLTSPDGTRVVLFDRVGDGGINFCQTVFADSAEQPIQAALADEAPYTGSWQPAEPLSGFRGHPGDGDWTLTVSDHAGSDTGSVRAFSLHLTGYAGRTG